MEDIKAKTYSSPQKGNRFNVSASESLQEKTDLLDVSASVKLSFLGGLIEAGGSAKYLNEKTSSTRQCRVTLDYHETTETRELMITELGAPDPEVLSKTDATHVVTMVLYGADALMEFQQTASDMSERQVIEGNLSVMIKKIPAVEISGEGSLNMNDEEKDMVKNFSCRFYGDYKLPEVPSSFEEAVKVYKQLPSLLGENGEKAVPVKVWLYPLSKLSNTESKLKAMISETLVSAVEKVMDDLHHAKIRTNDLLEKSKDIKAEDIVNKLKKFQSSLRVFTAEFLNKMTDLIPAIRGGDMENAKLKELLDFQDASGFSGKEMEQWLDGKEAEINIVTMYKRKLDYGIKTPGPELESFLMDPDVTDAFVFSFTSLKYEEPYLNKILQTATSVESPPEEVPWYRRPEAKKILNSALNVFNNKNSKSKVISFIPDPEHFGASVRWYHNAVLKDPHVTTYPLHSRNLLKNPCGNDQMKFWELVKNGGDGWKVQNITGPPDSNTKLAFVTSHGLCLKKQVIDLVAEGYSVDFLDTRPVVRVQDWYSGRTDCGSTYQLTVSLLDGNKKVLADFAIPNVTIHVSNASWRSVNATFSGYDKGLRFVSFEHGGKGSCFWKGWYGARVTDSSVTFESEKQTE